MQPTDSPHVADYLAALRATARLEGPLAPVLFLSLTTLARPRELEAPGTTYAPTGALTVQNTVGLADVRRRVIPLSASAAHTIAVSGGLDALLASVTHAGEALPQALQRSLSDVEGVCGLSTVDEVWRLAVAALVAEVPPSLTSAVLRYSGLAATVAAADPLLDRSLMQVAHTIDILVRRAGFDSAPGRAAGAA